MFKDYVLLVVGSSHEHPDHFCPEAVIRFGLKGGAAVKNLYLELMFQGG